MAGGVDYNQFKGKPFQVVSKLGVRYTGIFDHISQGDQTICLSQVYNHGREDRTTARKLAGSNTTLGWVRFHTESIESLALLDDYIPPGEEAPIDPILASVSQAPPSLARAHPPAGAPRPPQPPQRQASPPPLAQEVPYPLPRKPSTASASTALDRVQQSLSDLAVDGRPHRHQPSHRIDVPDAEFDFSKGNDKFEAEREAVREKGKEKAHGETFEVVDVGEAELPPHPLAVRTFSNGSSGSGALGEKSPNGYNKNSFFDSLSDGSSRVSRADERHRNFDTFGEAGGAESGAYGRGGMSGGRGMGGGRGGYASGGYQQNGGQSGRGGGHQQNGFEQGQVGYAERSAGFRGGFRGGLQGDRGYGGDGEPRGDGGGYREGHPGFGGDSSGQRGGRVRGGPGGVGGGYRGRGGYQPQV